ncbi:hypothetical protein, variant 2 [Aphanomyces astaci]|uniref:Peptidase M13 C-terminal domain-containing protein n=1 Tax=Aphanomyces astaci TaxID=112090 RepID=W4H8I8_APHAT|nr:hypothetical protein H257_01622 [Aphanomyces astaci]XP_009823223.1 hypothetical protein, variant 1 [Aphanomyces astaci]XP_009823224.1 hypothetical protein, variant 2 [Aphanomyces astaci]ETV88359.1 hypothetical protein H257_01622 [Aphanomyces astaci]ETV88360.1 hypothetical protein, variant 1 [Aphanomyces astaci]ETV88361.1 hypothetical protein, variant 2 [Aphanomyces astaci]|eukprot:XP_009823222.1 hypothetical protein H257_01622 [Aphanomyces astaci]
MTMTGTQVTMTTATAPARDQDRDARKWMNAVVESCVERGRPSRHVVDLRHIVTGDHVRDHAITSTHSPIKVWLQWHRLDRVRYICYCAFVLQDVQKTKINVENFDCGSVLSARFDCTPSPNLYVIRSANTTLDLLVVADELTKNGIPTFVAINASDDENDATKNALLGWATIQADYKVYNATVLQLAGYPAEQAAAAVPVIIRFGQSLAGVALNELEEVEATVPPCKLFYLSFAQASCSKNTDARLTKHMSDPHPPGRFRVIGVLQNNAEFAREFQCPTDSYLNPSKKCLLWE